MLNSESITGKLSIVQCTPHSPFLLMLSVRTFLSFLRACSRSRLLLPSVNFLLTSPRVWSATIFNSFSWRSTVQIINFGMCISDTATIVINLFRMKVPHIITDALQFCVQCVAVEVPGVTLHAQDPIPPPGSHLLFLLTTLYTVVTGNTAHAPSFADF